MKHIFTGLNLVCAVALLGLTIGCSTMQTKSKENLLIAAGFRVISPKTAAQQQLLNSLPPDKVTPIRHAGKRYYVFPDAAHNQAYVGRPTEYQRYRQLRLANQLSNENLEAAQMNEMASSGFDDWDGFAGIAAWD